MTEDTFIGRELLGQFRILERIGKGGMGAVYKAMQPAMDRLVAVKILHPNLAGRSDLVTRFRREARAMSRLTHPNTVRVFLYGQLEDESLYIVMEYLDGDNLFKLTRSQGPFKTRRAVAIMTQILGALEEAHSQGIVHRDLKPENIVLTEQGGIKDFPKVLDFGLAKIREQTLRPGSMVLTREGMVFGTPEFMSPEQAAGEILDPRTDLYSLAVIMYEMITGKLPFEANRPMEYITHHIKTPPIPVTKRVPDIEVDPRIEPILMHALEKPREKRFQSAREFAEAMRPILGGQSVSSPLRSVPSLSGIKTTGMHAVPAGSMSEKDGASDPPDRGMTVVLKRSSLVVGLAAAGLIILLLLAALIVVMTSKPSAGIETTAPAPAKAAPAPSGPAEQ